MELLAEERSRWSSRFPAFIIIIVLNMVTPNVYSAIGWKNMAILYAVLSAICLAIPAVVCKETKHLAPTETVKDEQPKVSFKVGIPLLVKNKYFWIILIPASGCSHEHRPQNIKGPGICLPGAQGTVLCVLQVIAEHREPSPVLPKPLSGEELLAEMQRSYEQEEAFIKEHESDLYLYERDVIDDFYKYRDDLLEIIPDFHMRLKVEQDTGNTIFVADIHSVFDIAWYTLARMIVDIKLTDEGIRQRTKAYEPKVCICKGCGRSFIKTAEQARKLYCGDPECERRRTSERVRRKRKNDKLQEQQKKAATKKSSGKKS